MFELVLMNNMTCFSVTLLHLYFQCSFPFIYITHDMALGLTNSRQNTHIEIIYSMRTSEENVCISTFQTCYIN